MRSSGVQEQHAQKVIHCADILKRRICINHPPDSLYSGQEFPVRMTPERRKSVLAGLNHRSMLTANDLPFCPLVAERSSGYEANQCPGVTR
jgi:hypothetical protein